MENDLTRGSVTKQLLRYSAPLIGTSLLQALYSIVDVAIAGHFVGGEGISAINTASLVMGLITQIIIGLTIGGNVLISQFFGAKDEENRKKASGSLFTLCMIGGLAGSVVFFVLSGPLVRLLNAPTPALAAGYLRISAVGVLFIFGYNALSAILRAVGNSRMPLYFIILAAVVNVGLDFLFVAGFGWGVDGAAAATVIAQGVAFLAALVFMLYNRAQFGFYTRFLKPARDKCKRILVLGLPLALQWTVASVSWMVVIFLINKYGVDVSAGNGVSNKIKDFCQLFITALSSGAATMVAQNLGAKQYQRAKQVMHTCLAITVAVAAALIVITELTAPWLVRVFTAEPEVQRWAVYNLRIEIIAQLFYAAFFSYNTLATGAGHTLYVMFNSFVNCIVARVVLALLLEHFFGLPGIYIACAAAPAVSVPIGWAYYRAGRWKKSPLVKAA